MITQLVLELLDMGAGFAEISPVAGGTAIFSDVNMQSRIRGEIHQQKALRGSPQWTALTIGVHQQVALRTTGNHQAFFNEW